MTTSRTGAARRADILPAVLTALNDGTLETATLAEGLAVDFALLLKAAVPAIPEESIRLVYSAASTGVTRRMELVGALLLQHLGIDGIPTLTTHSSDTVRGWAAYAIGLAPKLKLKDRLELLRPLAEDSHFGVREWAWLPLRPHVTANVNHAVKLLVPWTRETSHYLRRFASEVTRPRGVWTCHITALKDNPELGRPILEPLRADPEPYVQDSVANWLNDAGKSNATWLKTLTDRWRNESPCPETHIIIKRALRNIK